MFRCITKIDRDHLSFTHSAMNVFFIEDRTDSNDRTSPDISDQLLQQHALVIRSLTMIVVFLGEHFQGHPISGLDLFIQIIKFRVQLIGKQPSCRRLPYIRYTKQQDRSVSFFFHLVIQSPFFLIILQYPHFGNLFGKKGAHFLCTP